jgi:two-component system, NarL family, invasion response regulator UvrY
VIRVFIADDHAVVRRGVQNILSEDPGILLVGEASSGREALQLLRTSPCDVLLLDIAMPDGNGFEVLDQLRGLRTPQPRVLILSMYPEKQYARRALVAGAQGYLTKDSLPAELLVAIRKVAAGGKYIGQALAEDLAEELSGKSDVLPHQKLSEREFQVMAMLARGKTMTEIAESLALSESTARTYRSRILTKLGVRNTAEIIRYAIEHDLVS